MNKTNQSKHNRSSAISLDETKVTRLNLKTDELEEIPALDSSLCKQTLSGTLYHKIQIQTESDVHHNLSMLDNVLQCLQWLLTLPYETFWCQVVNDQGVHALLDSYLQNAPRYYHSEWAKELNGKHILLHRSVFMVFLRMSTLKESDEHFMSKQLFSNVLYDKYLFDIPRLMDLCMLYGVKDNVPLLKKMVENVFHYQPRFYDDLYQAAKTVSQIILRIEAKCLGRSESASLNKLSDASAEKMTVDEYVDIIYYISDIMKTLASFIVDVFTEASKPFYENKLLDRLVVIYCEVLPDVRAALRVQKNSLGSGLYMKLRGHVRQSRDYLLKVVHGIIQHMAYLPAVESAEGNQSEMAEEHVELYFQVLTSLLSNHRFFDDLCKKFNIKEDVQKLCEISPNVAEAHAAFLFHHSFTPNQPEMCTPASGSGSQFNDQPSTSKSSHSIQNGEFENTSLISSVKDVLPDLEIDFIKSCLSYYENNPEKVIQAILEENLPPHLMSQNASDDKGELSNHEDNDTSHSDLAVSSKPVDLLGDRKNVFDNDEFDIFSGANKVDLSRIHYGKRREDNVGHWKEDPDADVEKLRLLYNRYGLGADDTDNDEYLLRANPTSNYEDEYDDTYDDAPVGANDADSVDELGEESEEEERPRVNRYQDFVENPEVSRAKEEYRTKKREEYVARRGGKTTRQPRSGPPKNKPPFKKTSMPKNRPPAEKAPNEKDTLVEKTPTEKNQPPVEKTSNEKSPEDGQSEKAAIEQKRRDHRHGRGSHNRKALSAKKAGKGMFMGR